MSRFNQPMFGNLGMMGGGRNAPMFGGRSGMMGGRAPSGGYQQRTQGTPAGSPGGDDWREIFPWLKEKPDWMEEVPEITPDTLKQHDKDNQGNTPLEGLGHQGLPQGDGTTPGGGNWWDGIGFWGNPNFGPDSDPKQPLMNPDNFPTQGSGPFWGVDKQWLW